MMTKKEIEKLLKEHKRYNILTFFEAIFDLLVALPLFFLSLLVFFLVIVLPTLYILGLF